MRRRAAGPRVMVRAVSAPLAAAGPNAVSADGPPEDLPPDEYRPHRPVREVVGLGGWVLGWVLATVLTAGWFWLWYGFLVWAAGRAAWASPGVNRLLIGAGLVLALPVGAAVAAAVRLRRSGAACEWLVRGGRVAAVALAVVTVVSLWVLEMSADWRVHLFYAAVLGLPALGGLAFCLTGLWGRRFLDLKAW